MLVQNTVIKDVLVTFGRPDFKLSSQVMLGQTTDEYEKKKGIVPSGRLLVSKELFYAFYM